MTPAMGMLVRLATAGDVPAMRRIREAVRENRLSDPRLIPAAAYLPFVEARSIWVAEDRDVVVGFASIDATANSVWAIFVDPAAEGAGVGRRLHAHLLAWAGERGLDRLSLSTAESTRAARFYQRAGWRQAGTTATGEIRFEISLPS